MFTVLHSESSLAWGGQENRTLQESLGLRDRGARVIILCQPGSVLGEKARSAGFTVRTCPMRRSYDVWALRYILKVIRDEEVDIVSTHSGKDSLLAGGAARLSRRRPFIVRTRHLALPVTSPLSYNLVPHRVVTVSDYVRRSLIRQGVAGSKVVAVATGVDLDRFHPERVTGDLRKEIGLGDDRLVIGTVAILRVKKGHQVLLDAAAEILSALPGAVFVFAGNGPQRRNIAERVERLGIADRVHLLGLRDDVPTVLKAFDVFVLPTLEEALGTSFLEAMAMGKPVIGTKVGGVPEVVRDGVNGFLVPPRDPRALARATTRLLSDMQAAREMGRAGRAIAEREFTLEHMRDRMYELYDGLLRERR